MSFQGYLDNIRKKTGKTVQEFKKIAEEKGLLKVEVKAGEIIDWLKKEYQLGHGHAMAVYAFFKGMRPDDKKAAAKKSVKKVVKKIAKKAAPKKAVKKAVKKVAPKAAAKKGAKKAAPKKAAKKSAKKK